MPQYPFVFLLFVQSQTDQYALSVPFIAPTTAPLSHHLCIQLLLQLKLSAHHIFIFSAEMASTAPKTVKQLGQFLQEQQEPFILEIYLSERGYRKKNLDSRGSINSCEGNSGKFLGRSSSFSLNGSRKAILKFPKVFRVVCNKLASIKDGPRTKNNDSRKGKFDATEMARNSQQVTEPDRFSSASSTTVFNSCSESDVEEASTTVQKDDMPNRYWEYTSQSLKLRSEGEKEIAVDRRLGGGCMEESEQISPVSVLEEIQSHKVCPLARRDSSTSQEENQSKSPIFQAKKITEESLLSASLWNLLSSAKEKPCTEASAMELQELVRSKPTSQFFKSKRTLQQTKQLLFDCVRETLETDGKDRRQQKHKEFRGPELLGRLISEKLKTWGTQSGDEFSITRLLNLDFQDSAQEWIEFQPQMKDIAFAIVDAILEEIRDQTVIDMLYFSKI